ncbi:MAG TPA: poly-beta-1,6-N-acetyl-D-glucosamine biosynthesis protein PgaD [Roseomonas sp.]|nr:poly-beta-1,6-N-acetyl-D-glucosamine biosynthesis protein PgaD [Roseomonas sp.]
MHGPVRFNPPLILDAASRPRAARWRDAALTVLLWAGWCYLLAAAVGTLWVPPFVQRLLPVAPPAHPWDVIRIAVLCVAIATFACTILLLRVIAERRRFAGEDRRRAFPRPDDAAIAADFGVPAADLPGWRAARRLVVHHDGAGRITGVDAGGPVSR